MGKEKSIIQQAILKANTFIDFNKLFNLFHFFKLKIDVETSKWPIVPLALPFTLKFDTVTSMWSLEDLFPFFIFKITKQTWRTAG